jgi:hypothetical protein
MSDVVVSARPTLLGVSGQVDAAIGATGYIPQK